MDASNDFWALTELQYSSDTELRFPDLYDTEGLQYPDFSDADHSGTVFKDADLGRDGKQEATDDDLKIERPSRVGEELSNDDDVASPDHHALSSPQSLCSPNSPSPAIPAPLENSFLAPPGSHDSFAFSSFGSHAQLPAISPQLLAVSPSTPLAPGLPRSFNNACLDPGLIFGTPSTFPNEPWTAPTEPHNPDIERVWPFFGGNHMQTAPPSFFPPPQQQPPVAPVSGQISGWGGPEEEVILPDSASGSIRWAPVISSSSMSETLRGAKRKSPAPSVDIDGVSDSSWTVSSSSSSARKSSSSSTRKSSSSARKKAKRIGEPKTGICRWLEPGDGSETRVVCGKEVTEDDFTEHVRNHLEQTKRAQPGDAIAVRSELDEFEATSDHGEGSQTVPHPSKPRFKMKCGWEDCHTEGWSSGMFRHVKGHLKWLEIPCETCKKVYSRKYSYTRHLDICKGKESD